MMVVQRVQIIWAKATRGAPRANERAVLARKFIIPPANDNFNFHRYQMLEKNAFRAKLKERSQAAADGDRSAVYGLFGR